MTSGFVACASTLIRCSRQRSRFSTQRGRCSRQRGRCSKRAVWSCPSGARRGCPNRGALAGVRGGLAGPAAARCSVCPLSPPCWPRHPASRQPPPVHAAPPDAPGLQGHERRGGVLQNTCAVRSSSPPPCSLDFSLPSELELSGWVTPLTHLRWLSASARRITVTSDIGHLRNLETLQLGTQHAEDATESNIVFAEHSIPHECVVLMAWCG